MLVYDKEGLHFKYRPRLKITESFHSLQGEGAHAGLPCSFVRLTGCALRCTYCDSEYAFYGGEWQSFEQLIDYLHRRGSRLVQVTGGEPLHQKAVWPFTDLLVEQGFQPLIETSGAVDISGLNPKTHIVMDLKTPDSGESDRNLWANLDLLKSADEVKFVVCSSQDLQWSLDKIRELNLDSRFQVLISPVAEIERKGAMAETVLASGLNIRFQIQLHKLLWGDEAGR